MATTITANGINFPDGSASAPSIGGTDTNTGQFTGSDIVGFATGGVERIKIDAQGDIFIGTTSDVAPANGTNLCVSDGTISRLILEKQSTIKFGLNVSNGFSIYDETNDAQRFGIASNGNVSIGNNPTTHADYILHIEDSGETNIKVEGSTSTLGARISLQNNNTTANAYSQYSFNDAGGQSTSAIQGINTDQTNNYGEIAFLTRNAQGSPPSERVRVDKDGHVGIGRSSGLQLLDVKGGNDDAIKLSASAYGGGHLRITGADTNISGTGGPYSHCVKFKTKSQNSNGGNGAEKDALILYHEGWSGLNVASFPNSSVGIGTDNPTFASISGNSEKGLEIHNLGNDTAACLKLTGNNNSGGSPGQETYTQLEHRGGNLTFNINHNGTERFKIDAQGNVHASDGNFVVASGHGIDFSATANSSGTTTAELLDDYEYGSFTPFIEGSTTSGSVSYSARNGFYIKIGRLVQVYVDFTVSSWSGAAGNQRIGGFPFTKNELSGQAYYYEGVAPWYVMNNLTNSKSNYQGYIGDNNTLLNIYVGNTCQTDTTGPVNVTGRASFSFTYTTSS